MLDSIRKSGLVVSVCVCVCVAYEVTGTSWGRIRCHVRVLPMYQSSPYDTRVDQSTTSRRTLFPDGVLQRVFEIMEIPENSSHKIIGAGTPKTGSAGAERHPDGSITDGFSMSRFSWLVVRDLSNRSF